MSPPDFERWKQLWQRAGCRRDAGPTFEILCRAYSEPQRDYHNFQHIAECLTLFDSAGQLAKDPEAVEMAIWFHDAVYDPKAPDNEERSAELARQHLIAAEANTDFVARVSEIVIATKTHNASGNADTAFMLDIDLSILGQEEKRFREYEDQIQKEYAWVPKSTYVTKRAAILKGFLERERIYVTDYCRDRFEQQARTNLRWSIQKLESAL